MTPEKLELLRKWVQAECRQVYYKLEHEDKIYEGIKMNGMTFVSKKQMLYSLKL